MRCIWDLCCTAPVELARFARMAQCTGTVGRGWVSGPTPQAPPPCGLVSVVTFLCAKLVLVLVNLCLQCMYMKMLKAFAIPNAAIPRAGIRKLGVLTPDSRYYEANSAFHCHGVD